jgi:hypothetical protein
VIRRYNPILQAMGMLACGCASSEGWRVQQETDLPGKESEAP